MNGSSWSPDEDSLALQYLAKGKTFAEVAKILGKTKGSVISRAHRKKWAYPGKKNPREQRSYTLKRPREKTFVNKAHPEIPRTPVENDLVMLDNAKENQCRFIIGEAKYRKCCGQKTLVGRSWCAHHAATVYAVSASTFRRLASA